MINRYKTLGDLPRIPKEIWLKIGVGLIDRIRKDASKGISQDDSDPTFADYDIDYKDFKSRGDAVDGRATDSQVEPPNLKFTGDMLKLIEAERPTEHGVTISFKFGTRVLDNIEIKNRNIFDIRAKNMEWAKAMVLQQVQANAKGLPKKTTIKI